MIVRVFTALMLLFVSNSAFASYSSPGSLFTFGDNLCLNSNGNFRAGPSTNSKVLAVIAKDQKYYADAMTGDGYWFRFQIGNQTGFIHRSVLRHENCS